MFDRDQIEGLPVAGVPVDEDCFDPAWLDEAAWLSAASEPPEEAQLPVSVCAPSGWLALELDQGCADPAVLADSELIDAVIGFDRVASWALARQAVLLAEFARRRPGDHPLAANSDTPSRCSEFAPDEVALALRLSRMTATGRLVMAQTLVEELPGTLAAWEAGVIDSLKARAITETSSLLPGEQRSALEARVLPHAGTQTIAQLRAALTRAVLALDPKGADARHRQRRQDRRVVVSPDEEGMASLWALLSAPDATAAYQRLCDLARGLGSEDTHGMDARRADLLVELLTGRRCAATGSCMDQQCPGDCDCSGDGCPDDAPDTASTSTGTTSTGTTPDPAPDPADYGRTTYSPPTGLADFIRARDLHCRNPICGQPAARADLDHTIPYQPEGTTSEHNLHASCRHHHRLKTHAPGWQVDQHLDDRITWTTPTGHTYTSNPHDYRPDLHPPPGDDPPPF